jgi:hypothetical protein
MAKDGADPDSEGRRALGFDKPNAALKDAIRQRMQTLQDFGCTLTFADRLANSVRSAVQYEGRGQNSEQYASSGRESIGLLGQVATAADVLRAHRRGANLNLGPAARVTPLAHDLAGQLGVALLTTKNR